MFGWFKRNRKKPVTIAASWDLEPSRYVSVWFKSEGRAVRVLSTHRYMALNLIALIETAKRQKKKHSHLLAELKALEVK